MTCLMCKRALEAIDTIPPTRSSPVNDGGTAEVSFGYGSRHDCKTALGFICDDCFEENAGLFVNHYDGMREPS